MNTYKYINATGGTGTIQADTPDVALKSAKDIAKDSGVQLVQSAPTAGGVVNAGDTKVAVPGAGIVSSSDPVVANENQIKQTVAGFAPPENSTDGATTASQDYQKVLQDYYDKLEQRRADEVDSINAQFDETQRQTEKGQKSETATTNAALFKVGGYLGTQVSGVGVLNNLAETHRIEIAALQSKRQAAIQAAKNAIDDKQFAVAQAKAAEVKGLEKEINDRKNKFFEQTISGAKADQDKATFDRTQAEKLSEDIAGTMSEHLNGDFESPEAQKFIVDSAKQYGIDPNVLFNTVKAYDTKQHLDILQTYTSDQKNYEFAKKGGYKGSFTQYLKWSANLVDKVASGIPVGTAAGLTADDPIYFATVGVNSNVLREQYINQYAAMKKAGKNEAAASFVDRLVYQGLTAAQKTDFNLYNNSLQTGKKALSVLEDFKTKDFNVYKTALEGAKPLAVLERDQKWVDAVAKIEIAQAQIRRSFFGTAVTDTEKSSADGFFIDKAHDDLASAKTKLQNLIDLANQHKYLAFQAGLGNYEGTGGDTPTAKTVKIGGQDVTVGSIIQNSKGEKGLVNSDGTITKL